VGDVVLEGNTITAPREIVDERSANTKP
jgi:hypothetical protein